MKDTDRAIVELISAVSDLYVVVDKLMRRQNFIDPDIDGRMKAVHTACSEAHEAARRSRTDGQASQVRE